jgi:hypothetical protein
MLAASLMRQRSRYTGQTGASQSGIADLSARFADEILRRPTRAIPM